MAPVRRGSVDVFWKLACNVTLQPSADDVWSGDVFVIDDNWYAYERSHIHGTGLYCVAPKLAKSELKTVTAHLERSDQADEDSWFLRGYRKWRDDTSIARNDADALLHCVRQTRLDELRQRDPDLYACQIRTEEQVHDRWRRAKWFWAALVFEWCFFTGLLLIAVWPAMKGHPPLRWFFHFAILPVVFVMPVYLGYATYTFTSAGPSGGVLYPFAVMWFRGGSVNTVDRWLLSHTPQILEPLSTPIGSPMALTGMGMPGPTTAVITGLILGTLAFVLRRGYVRLQLHHLREKNAH